MFNRVKSRHHEINDAVKAAFWFTCANVAQKAIAFLYIPLYTRLVSTEEFGIWSIWQTSYQVLLIVGSFYLYTGVFNNGMIKYENEEERDKYTAAMTGLSSLCTVILLGLYMLVAPHIDSFLGLPDLLVYLMFLQIFLTPSLNYWMVRNRFENKYKSVVSVTIGISLLIPILSLSLMCFFGKNATAITVGYVLGNSIFGFMCLLRTLKHSWKDLFCKKDWKYALKFNTPLLPYYVANIVLAQIDRVMIGVLCSSSLAGVYSLASQINLALTVVISGINSAFIPWMYRKLKEKNITTISRVINCIIALVGSICVIVVMFGPEILSLLGPEDYQMAKWVIPPILLGSFAICLQTLFYNIELYFAVTRKAALISVLGAVLKVGLNFFLIPYFGIYAAGWTTLGCYLLLAILHYCVARKALIQNKLIGVLDSKKFLVCFACVAILTLLMMLLYEHVYIRIFIFGVVVVIVACARKKVFQTLKGITGRNA